MYKIFYDNSIVYLMMTFFSFYDREFEVYAVILVLSPLFCGKISSQFTNPHSRTQICSSNRNRNKDPTSIRKAKIAKIWLHVAIELQWSPYKIITVLDCRKRDLTPQTYCSFPTSNLSEPTLSAITSLTMPSTPH